MKVAYIEQRTFKTLLTKMNMKTKRLIPLALLGCFFATNSFAQDDDKYTEGNVVMITMIRTGANAQDEYLKQLSTYYVPMMTKAKAQGLIVDFKLLAGGAANEDDFDVMLMTEHSNMAALDPDPARKAKWDAIRKELDTAMGGEEKAKVMVQGYEAIRDMRGSKLMRVQIPK